VPVVAPSIGQPIGVDGADDACLLKIPPYTGVIEAGGAEVVEIAELGGLVVADVVAAGAVVLAGAEVVAGAAEVAGAEVVALVVADVVVEAADEQAVSKTAAIRIRASGMKNLRADIFFSFLFYRPYLNEPEHCYCGQK